MLSLPCDERSQTLTAILTVGVESAFSKGTFPRRSECLIMPRLQRKGPIGANSFAL
jgi:hypothetical protein